MDNSSLRIFSFCYNKNSFFIIICYSVLVPDDVNPQEMLNIFDQPEKLTILINYDVPIICLKEYSEAVIELLGELENDILQPINGDGSETRILN